MYRIYSPIKWLLKYFIDIGKVMDAKPDKV